MCQPPLQSLHTIMYYAPRRYYFTLMTSSNCFVKILRICVLSFFCTACCMIFIQTNIQCTIVYLFILVLLSSTCNSTGVPDAPGDVNRHHQQLRGGRRQHRNSSPNLDRCVRCGESSTHYICEALQTRENPDSSRKPQGGPVCASAFRQPLTGALPRIRLSVDGKPVTGLDDTGCQWRLVHKGAWGAAPSGIWTKFTCLAPSCF